MLSTNRERLLDPIAEEFDAVLVAAKEIREAHSIVTARADSLDKIGEFFGHTRRINQADYQFRSLLESLITVFNSAGTKDAIKVYLSALLSIDINTVKIFELYPGYIELYIPSTFMAEEDTIRQAVLQVVAVGITIDFVWATTYWDDPEAQWDADDYWV